MTFADRCNCYGIRIVAWRMRCEGFPLSVTLNILRGSGIKRVRQIMAGVWVPT